MAQEVYLGNPNLKKANTPIEFKEEEIIEFLKCKEDPVYFARNYIKNSTWNIRCLDNETILAAT